MDDLEQFGWRRSWVAKKVKLAECLAGGGCGGGYPEVAMVLCGVLNALAAELWPGPRKDKKRFVELLVRHTAPELGATTISIPLLTGHLRDNGLLDEETKLRLQWLNVDVSQVIYGPDVDTTEDNIVRLCPSLPLSMVRRFSYATLLYEEIRSGYAHEYANAARSDSAPMGRRPGANVSYVNRRDLPDRLIYFSPRWMAALASSAEALSSGAVADKHFSNWWLDPT